MWESLVGEEARKVGGIFGTHLAEFYISCLRIDLLFRARSIQRARNISLEWRFRIMKPDVLASNDMLHEVITTEKVPFTYRVAGLGSRFLAWLVDAGLIIILGTAGICAGSVLELGRQGLGIALVLLWIFALSWGYFLLFEWLWRGETPGKRLLGIRVIQWQGTSVTFYQSAVRNILRALDSLPLFYPLGFCVAASNRENRRLGDLAAGTLVVHVDRKAKPIQALQETFADFNRVGHSSVRQRIAQLERAQKQTLLDLCLRRDQLSIRDRAQLFRTTAEFLRQRLNLMPEEHLSDEKFVLQLAAVLGTRSGFELEAVQVRK